MYTIENDRGTLKQDARKNLTEFKDLFKPKTQTKSLSQFKEEFFSYVTVNYATGTVDIFKVGLRNLEHFTGDCLLTAIAPPHVDTYKTNRLKMVSPISVNVELRGLRAVFNVAYVGD